MGLRSKINKSGLFDFLIEALKAEGMTQTGRINITVTVLMAACILVIVPANSVETIASAIVVYFDKEPLDLVSSTVIYLIVLSTIAIFVLCLWVVRDMEQKKTSQGKKVSRPNLQ